MRRTRSLSLPICALIGLCHVGCGSTGQIDTHSKTASAKSDDHVTEKGPVKLSVTISPREPRLSDMVEMRIRVTALPEVEVKPPTFGQAVGDFVIRDFSEKSSQLSSPKPDEPSVREFHYQLEPMSAGRHLIRSIAIEFVDHRANSEQRDETAVIESEPFELNVTSELADQVPDLANLEPMVPPRPLDSSSSWAWVWWIFGLLLVAGIAGWLFSRRRKKVTGPPSPSPEEIAHAAFKVLMSENLPGQGRLKEFYLRLTGIVRTYIEATTGLRAPDQTTEEFLRAMRLRNVFSAERSIRLQEFLEAADMVKYAGQQPDPDQIELSISRAREFVDLRSSAAQTVVMSGGNA